MEALVDSSSHLSGQATTRHRPYGRTTTELEPRIPNVLTPGFMIGKDGNHYHVNPQNGSAEEATGLVFFHSIDMCVPLRRHPIGPTDDEILAVIPPELLPHVQAFEDPTPNFFMRSHGVDGLLREHFHLKLYKKAEQVS